MLKKKNPGNPQKLTVTNLNDSLYTNTVRLRYLKNDWIVLKLQDIRALDILRVKYFKNK